MSNYVTHANNEFRAAGWTDADGKFKDDMQEMICNHVMKLLEVFDGEGHSGSSAPYTIGLFKTLASFEPIGPLTGEDWEWSECREGVYQNKRMGSVFKQADRFNGQAYWLDGKVFWEWCRRPLDEDEQGYPGDRTFKSYFTSRESMVPITFPWKKPEKPEYVFVPTEEFPNEVLE